MFTRGRIVLLSGGILIAAGFAAGQGRPLLPRHQRWLQVEVEAIVTETEKDVFRKLETDEDRDRFVEEFWRQRDPTPATPRNEFKDEHYRRIDFANKTFGRNSPDQGWRTPRGRAYIKLGPPADVERFDTGQAYPLEIWYFYGNPGIGQPSYFRLVFYRRGGSGDYLQYHPLTDGPKVLVPNTIQNIESDGLARMFEGELATPEMAYPRNWDEDDRQAYKILRNYVSIEAAEATYSLVPGTRDPGIILASAVMLGEIERSPQKKVRDEYALDFLTHKASVEVSYSVHQIGNRSVVGVFQAPSGMFFLSYLVVPETLALENYQDKYIADLKTTLRVSDGAGRTVFQQEKFIPVELRKEEVKAVEKKSFHFSDAIPIIPGIYAFDLLVENTVSKEFTTVSKSISLPGDDRLWMTPLLLARDVATDAISGGAGTAFQAATCRLYPSINRVFKQKDPVYVYFQMFGLGEDLRGNGAVEYTVTRQNKVVSTTRKAIRELPHSSESLWEFATSRNESGTYVVRAALLDGQGREVLADEASFQIQAEAPPGLWVVAQDFPPLEDPVHSFVLGNQFLNIGLAEKGFAELRKAHEKKPESREYALGYARALQMTKDPAKARDILLPFARSGEPDFEICESLGRVFQDLKDPKGAISWYEKALTLKGNPVDALNALGECHFSLGNKEAALKAWSRSLEINPNQDYIRKMVEGLKR